MHRFLAAALARRRRGRGGHRAVRRRSGDADSPLLRKAHWAIDKVTARPRERFAFNTAIAAVMELVNDVYAPDGARDAGAGAPCASRSRPPAR